MASLPFGSILTSNSLFKALDNSIWKFNSSNNYTRLSIFSDFESYYNKDEIDDIISTIDTDISTALLKTGGTMTGELFLSSSVPTNALSAITKSYLDNAITGITWKNSVRAATTANITLSGLQTVDGVSLVAGNRVLVKNQTTQSQNGIYIVSTGAWTRATDADSPDEINTATVAVNNLGTINKNSQWTTTSTITTIGVDPITFTNISGAGTYTNGTNLDLSGNVFSVVNAPTFSGAVTASSFVKAGATASDLLLGNGTTASTGSFILNQTTQQATSNFNISGVGRAGVATMGQWAFDNTQARFGHFNFNNGTSYGYMQDQGGGLRMAGTSINMNALVVTSTTEQLRLAYDATNNVKHTVSSAGNYTIAPTGGVISLTASTNVTVSNLLAVPSIQTNTLYSSGVSGIKIIAPYGASSGITYGFEVTPTINSSGTNSYIGQRIAIYELGVGSGTKTLFSAGTSTAAQGGGTYTEKFSVDNAGNTTANGYIRTSGAFSGTPTASTGAFDFFNAGMNFYSWGANTGTSGNFFWYANNSSGSSSVRVMYIDGNGQNVGIGTGGTPPAKLGIQSLTQQLQLNYDASNYNRFTVGNNGATIVDLVGTATQGFLTFRNSANGVMNLSLASSAGTSTIASGASGIKISPVANAFEVDGTIIARTLQGGSSGIRTIMVSNPTISQSGTAGYTAIQANVVESALGSGLKLLIDLGTTVSSVYSSKFSVDNTGKVTSVSDIESTGTGSGIILKDTVAGTRHRVTLVSGVLTVSSAL